MNTLVYYLCRSLAFLWVDNLIPKPRIKVLKIYPAYSYFILCQNVRHWSWNTIVIKHRRSANTTYITVTWTHTAWCVYHHKSLQSSKSVIHNYNTILFFYLYPVNWCFFTDISLTQEVKYLHEKYKNGSMFSDMLDDSTISYPPNVSIEGIKNHNSVVAEIGWLCIWRNGKMQTYWK